MSNILLLKNVKLAFPQLVNPAPNRTGALRYSVSLLLPKNDPQIAAINDAIMVEMQARFKDKAQMMYASLKSNAQAFCFRDGDDPIAAAWGGFSGNMFLKCNNDPAKIKPVLVDGILQPLTELNPPQSGDICNAKVSFLAYNKNSNGITCRIHALQVLQKGSLEIAPVSLDGFDDLSGGLTSDDV